MRCFVLDDQQEAVDSLSRKIAREPGLQLVGGSTNALEVLNKILSGNLDIDLLFADIEMPDLSGIDLARQLQGCAFVIFVTGYIDFAFEAYELGAVGYLRKPASEPRLTEVIKRAKEIIAGRQRIALDQPSYVFLKMDKGRIDKVIVKDIIMIQGDRRYTKLYCRNYELPLLSQTMNYFEEILPEKSFVRIHKSYLINLDHLERVRYKMAVMSDGRELPIGPAFLAKLYKKLNAG